MTGARLQTYLQTEPQNRPKWRGIVLVVRCPRDTSTEQKKTCETAKTKWTPKSPKQGEIDTSALPSDLAEIVAAWPELPSAIRSAIVAIVSTSRER